MDRPTLLALTRGPIATLPTAFDTAVGIDLPVMADRTEWWIEQGLTSGRAILKVAAAMGEGPDLSDVEWPRVLDAVVRTADGRRDGVCALKTKGTLETIEDAKRAQDLGAVGLQIDLPIFHHPTQDDMRRYFTDISAAIDVGILIYNTWWFANGSFGDRHLAPATVRGLAETTEHVVGIKWSTPPEADFDSMTEFADVLSVIDNSGDVVRCMRNGGAGYISDPIVMNPSVDLRLWQLIEAERWSDAQAELDRVHNAIGEFVGRTRLRSGGDRVTKGILKLLGLSMGDPRPPTLALQPDEMADARELLARLGWAVPTAGRSIART